MLRDPPADKIAVSIVMMSDALAVPQAFFQGTRQAMLQPYSPCVASCQSLKHP